MRAGCLPRNSLMWVRHDCGRLVPVLAEPERPDRLPNGQTLMIPGS